MYFSSVNLYFMKKKSLLNMSQNLLAHVALYFISNIFLKFTDFQTPINLNHLDPLCSLFKSLPFQ